MAHTLTVSAQDGKLPAAIFTAGFGSASQGVPGWRVGCSCGWVEKAESEMVALHRYRIHQTIPQKG